MNYSIGIDLGAKNLKVVMIDEQKEVVKRWTYAINGQPIIRLQQFVEDLLKEYSSENIISIGATGSGHSLAGAILGANYSDNEVGVYQQIINQKYPEIRTIIDLGDQESKIISIEDGQIKGKGLSKDCQRGLGSLLDRQINQYQITNKQWDELAQDAEIGERISAKCTLYMERDVVKKQQQCCPIEQIIKGTNQAIIRCLMQNVAKGIIVAQPALFIGGVANLRSITQELEQGAGIQVEVPMEPLWFSAEAVALAAKDTANGCQFRGAEILNDQYHLERFPCDGCDNQCPIIGFTINDQVVTYWGGKCDKWSE